MLRPGGTVLMNAARLVPPIVELGLFPYPDDPVGELKKLGLTVHAFNANELALSLGNLKLGNTVMLGAMADYLPFPADVLLAAILKRFSARKPQMVDMNRQAFEQGRAAIAADSTAPA
jgi:indolepyruvate ferredoxin oxidoreductase beta subunit